ncbi:MAG: glutamate racemase [Cellulosilyticaceae bacterium]
MNNRPIGIFDSGVGGLTVVKDVMKQLPNESIVYFGDTARVPYGSKSKGTVTKFSAQIIRFLIKQDVKAIIIACNTVNSNCIEELRAQFPDIPISGVVEPGVAMALRTTKNKRIGVIGTEATINSGRYPELLKSANKELEVFGKACPVFVPLVEDGWAEHHVTQEVASVYLAELLEQKIDSLILGCTHYPMLTSTIQKVVGAEVTLLNPANEAAHQMGEFLREHALCSEVLPTYKFYVSDHAERVKSVAKMFLDYPVEEVDTIDIERY